MVKAIVAVAFGALVIYACVRVGDSAWRHYQLKDAIEQEVRFGNVKTVSEMRRRLLTIASDYGIWLEPTDMTVERRGFETHVAFQYVEQIPLVPGTYTHEQLYDVTFTVQPLRPLVDDVSSGPGRRR
jgi:hypothetical protein